MKFAIPFRPARILLCTSGLAFLAAAAVPAALAAASPGAGVTVQPVKSNIPEEDFQTEIVMQGLKQLGYQVKPVEELSDPTMYVAIAQGEATFLADGWFPLHDTMYKNAGGDAKLWRKNDFSADAIQGYLIDKKTADKYHISNIAQFKDPKIAKLFAASGHKRAQLVGCDPGWGCEGVIRHQLKAFGLTKTVHDLQGDYSALIANAITRYKAGKPIFYYTWTPYWVSDVLIPGKDVVWLQVPFSSLPGARKGQSTKLPNGQNYGFVVNTQRIVANRKFIEANPAAKKFFQEVKVPVGDINAQNHAMQNGANTPADVRRQVHGWIQAHHTEWARWIAAAETVAKK